MLTETPEILTEGLQGDAAGSPAGGPVDGGRDASWPPGACPNCDYDVRHCSGGRCSECGFKWDDPVMERTLRARIPHRWLLWALLAVTLSMCLYHLAFSMWIPAYWLWRTPDFWSVGRFWRTSNAWLSAGLLVAAAVMCAGSHRLRPRGRTLLHLMAASSALSLLAFILFRSPNVSEWRVLWWLEHAVDQIPIRHGWFYGDLAWLIALLGLLHFAIPTRFAERLRFAWSRSDRGLLIVLTLEISLATGMSAMLSSVDDWDLRFVTGIVCYFLISCLLILHWEYLRRRLTAANKLFHW